MKQNQVIITNEIAERDKANNYHHINRITMYLFGTFFLF